MKRIALISLIFALSFQIYGQQVILQGKILSDTNQIVRLTVHYYDVAKLNASSNPDRGAWSIGTPAIINKDRTYRITTDKITRPFTFCTLSMGTCYRVLVLCPGDSLNWDLDYWTLKESESFSGRGVSRNLYWLRQRQTFDDSDKDRSVRVTEGANRIGLLAKYYGEAQNLAATYFQNGTIDSSFFAWESKRITYQYYIDLISGVVGDYTTEPAQIDQVIQIIKDVDLNDEVAFYTLESYRKIIEKYFGFLQQYQNHEKQSLFGLLDQADRQLTGLIRTYYKWSVLKSAIGKAGDPVKRKTIINMALERIKEPELISKLESYETTPGEKSQHYPSLVGSIVGSKWFKWTSDDPRYVNWTQNKSGETITAVPVEKNKTGDFLTKITRMLFILVILILMFIGWQFYRQFTAHRIRHNVQKFSMIFALSLAFLWFIMKFNFQHYYFFGLQCTWQIVNVLCFQAIFLFWFLPGWGKGLRRKSDFLLVPVLVILFAMIEALLFKQAAIGTHWMENWPKFALQLIIKVLIAFFWYGFITINCSRLLRKQSGSLNILRGIEYMLNAALITLILMISLKNNENGYQPILMATLGMLIFYIHAFWVFPVFLFRKRFREAIYLFIGLFLLTGALLTINESLLMYKGYSQAGIIPSFYETLVFPGYIDLYLLVIPAFLYAFIKHSILSHQATGYSLYRKKDAELNQLKSQVNPHFLFNSLNNVYAFALEEEKSKTAECIANLANLMRYLIEDMEQDVIPISREIGYIQDYINLQSIRSSVEHSIEVNNHLTEELMSKTISPMLMIPFIENAFKHGMNPHKSSFLKIDFSFEKSTFHFTVENLNEDQLETFYKEKGFGIGIENVRKRLQLLYPDSHHLQITNNSTFRVDLKISNL